MYCNKINVWVAHLPCNRHACVYVRECVLLYTKGIDYFGCRH